MANKATRQLTATRPWSESRALGKVLKVERLSTLRFGGCEISVGDGLISPWHSVGAQSELRSAQHQMSREKHREKSDVSNSMRGIMWVMCYVCVANSSV